MSDLTNRVCQIRAARLDQFEHRAGTGHSATDVKMLVNECRRFRAFLSGLADDLQQRGLPDLVAEVRAASRAIGE